MHIKVRFFEKRGFSSHNTHIHIGFIIREKENYDDENIVNKEYLKKKTTSRMQIALLFGL